MPRTYGNVWDHFKMLSENDRKRHVTCNYCNLPYKFAQATRLREHLLKCQKCPIVVKNKIKCVKKPVRVPTKPRFNGNCWEHFVTLTEIDRKKHVACKYCKLEYKFAQATRLKEHLMKCQKGPVYDKYKVKQEKLRVLNLPRSVVNVWDHFLTLDTKLDGKKHVTCNYCNTEYKLAQATKLKEHLLRCENCPTDVKNEINCFKKPIAEVNLPSSRFVPSITARIVWDHFVVVSQNDAKKHVKCNYCRLQYKFAQATRLKEHLLKCPKCPMKVKYKIKCLTNSKRSKHLPRSVLNVWEHFLMLSETDGKRHVACNYCNVQYKYATATRLKEHLLKCDKCPIELRKTIERVQKPTNVTELESSTEPLATTSAPWITSVAFTSTSEDIPDESQLEITYNHTELDTVLARAIYASGVPLSLLESEYWQDVFKLLDSSYTVPSRHALSNSLLEAEFARSKRNINEKFNKSMALGLICDGWTNIGKAINFIVTTPTPIFYNAINPDAQRLTGEYLSEQIMNIIEEIDPDKLVIIITDNTAIMKATWKSITYKYPHISCVGCITHSLNLIFKDIFKINLFKDILENVLKVIKYIKTTNTINAIFENHQTEKYGSSSTSLKLFSNIRWSEVYVTLDSYNVNKDVLEIIAKSRKINVMSEIKEIILNRQLWAKIDEVLKVLQPLTEAIVSSEKSTALLSDVPLIFYTLNQDVTTQLETSVFISKKDQAEILSAIQNRKESCIKPIHYAAHQLDPRYCGICLSDNDMVKVISYLKKISNTMNIEVNKVLQDIADFTAKENMFDSANDIWAVVEELEPKMWWKTFSDDDDIATIAAKILSVAPSAAVFGQNELISAQTDNGNQLTDIETTKLMTIRSNLNSVQKEIESKTIIVKTEEYIKDSDVSDYDSVEYDSPTLTTDDSE